MQEINLDWILTKVKNILRFVPDDGSVGQILRRTAHGAEWSNEQGGGGAVTSVNGQTGDVVLAIPDSTSDLINDSGFVDAAGAAAAAPVQKVNGQTGDVVLSIPDSTSDLVNDSGFVDAAGAAAAAPVQSVNGQTGAVVLDSFDDTGVITFTRTLGSGTFQQFACQKVGNVVNCGARAYGISQPAAGNWFRVPDGFRPRSTVMVAGVINTGSWIPLWATIDSNGYVTIDLSTGQTANQVVFYGTYPI